MLTVLKSHSIIASRLLATRPVWQRIDVGNGIVFDGIEMRATLSFQ